MRSEVLVTRPRTRHATGHRRPWLAVVAVLALLLGVLVGASPQVPVAGQVAEPTTFQTAIVDDSLPDPSDTQPRYLTFPAELPDDEECPPQNPSCPPGRPELTPIPGTMTAAISNAVVIPGGEEGDGLIGGDVLELDLTITNTSPSGSGVVLSAYAFQSKHSESPALGSRIGDKLFAATQEGVTAGPGTDASNLLSSVKKNGTSNGLYSGKWKGICINSSTDFRPELNAGLSDESLECAGSRTDTDGDGEPELDTSLLGLRPGESQTVRLRLDSGTTDGALQRVPPGTLTGTVGQRPDGFPTMAVPGTVTDIVDFTDNKVFFQADGSFDPSFAPAADGFTLDGNEYVTLPRVNYAFTDLLGRNHTCGTYGVTEGACAGNPGASPLLNILGDGDLVPGAQNLAAILQGFGEYVEVAPGEYELPTQPYGVTCENCAGAPYTPIAEFYVDNGDGTVTRQMSAGSYGELGSSDELLATIDSTSGSDITQEIVPEQDPGGPRPGPALGTSAAAEFSDLTVVPGGGANGGDAIEFTVDIANTSSNEDAHLTAFNFQTKERGLADIGRLDGTSQDRRNIAVDPGQPPCTSPTDGACYNAELGIGHFPNVIGNGLLFGQMVWPDADAGREPDPVDSDQVYVDPVNGITPTPYWLESVKKNGPFTPILKGNENFICVKSGLFDLDPDADAACAGQPAILSNPDGEPTPGNIDQRLGLPAGESQTVRLRMDFGDFRGVLARIAPGTLQPLAEPYGLRRSFDCSDQRELEFCHPDLVGSPIGYLPGTTATWLTPASLEDVEYVIFNQPGFAPTVMDFEENLGFIMAMAGFVPSAEFYAPDTNPELDGTPLDDVLIRQQVLGDYGIVAPLPTDEPDTTPPTSAIGSPAPSQTLPAGSVAFEGTTGDDTAVASVAVTIEDRANGRFLRRDGTWGDAEKLPTTLDGAGGWRWEGSVPPGRYRLVSEATDAAGNVQEPPLPTHDFRLVDSARPTSRIVEPTVGTTLPRGSVRLAATASDDVAVSEVRVIVFNASTFRYLRPNGRWSILPASIPAVHDAATDRWSITATLPRGTYLASSTAVDTSRKLQIPPHLTYFFVR
jgi:hypothetical protein